MKKYIKALTLFLAIITCFCFLFGCKKAGPIPNGFYGCSNEGKNVYKFTKSDISKQAICSPSGSASVLIIILS